MFLAYVNNISADDPRVTAHLSAIILTLLHKPSLMTAFVAILLIQEYLLHLQIYYVCQTNLEYM